MPMVRPPRAASALLYRQGNNPTCLSADYPHSLHQRVLKSQPRRAPGASMGNGRLRAAIISVSVSISLLTATPLRAQTPGAAPAWPHTLTVNGVNVVVYQPQAIDWPNHETLTTREAISNTLPGEK